jgi:hypothetical protein
MDIKQHLPHLIGLPPAIGVVVHTHSGLGFEPAALSLAVSISLAAGVWAAWSHVLAPRVPLAVRAFGLCAALVLSGAEGYLMYQHKGDMPDQAYVAAQANYDLQASRYGIELAGWQANHNALVSSIKAQQQEIIARDKLTTRRADMERLTVELAKATNANPPAFGLERPVRRTVVDRAWLSVTAATVGLTPLLYGVFHMFGWRRRDQTKTATATTTAERTGIRAVLTVDGLPVGATFACPVCGAAATKRRKDMATCGKGACRVVVSRLRNANHGLSSISSHPAFINVTSIKRDAS